MSCKITFCDSVPRDVKALIRPVLYKYRFILPVWMNSLAVMYWQSQNEEKEDAPAWLAHMDADWEYRQAKLVICPRFREITNNGFRELVIAHELTHALLSPIQSWGNDMLETVVSDDEHRAMLQKTWIKANEAVTEDTSAIFVARERKHRR